jgi:nucleotide-binding universal stress UspA family protein
VQPQTPMKIEPAFSPRHILCPVDLSEHAALALKYAAAGARAFNATLTVLQAIELELPPYFTPGQMPQLSGEARQAREAAAQELTRYVHAVLGGAARDLTLRVHAVEGHPTDVILDTAERTPAELIVMGTHGRGGARRLLLGSVTENVVRQARVPVFVVRQKQHEFLAPDQPTAQPHLRRILCAVVPGAAAHACLQSAAALAIRFGAELTALHVVGDAAAATEAAREQLCAWLPSAIGQCAVRPEVRRGRAAEQIMAFAQETRQDLIVLAAQAKPERSGLFYGTTTETVLRRAPVPVLVIPQHP